MKNLTFAALILMAPLAAHADGANCSHQSFWGRHTNAALTENRVSQTLFGKASQGVPASSKRSTSGSGKG